MSGGHGTIDGAELGTARPKQTPVTFSSQRSPVVSTKVHLKHSTRRKTELRIIARESRAIGRVKGGGKFPIFMLGCWLWCVGPMLAIALVLPAQQQTTRGMEERV